MYGSTIFRGIPVRGGEVHTDLGIKSCRRCDVPGILTVFERWDIYDVDIECSGVTAVERAALKPLGQCAAGAKKPGARKRAEPENNRSEQLE